jgi:hypothetical protein
MGVNMNPVDNFYIKLWGFSVTGLRCKIKLVINRLIRLVFKWLNKETYMRWDWFKKPLDLKECIFVSEDGLLFKGYDIKIFLHNGPNKYVIAYPQGLRTIATQTRTTP